MIKPAASTASAIGFVSVLEHDSHFFGGLLVLDPGGRPLEFHCTAPIKPTQSHTVLYGPALRSFVMADSIVPKLVSQCKAQLDFVCTDSPEITEADLKELTIVFVPAAIRTTDAATMLAQEHSTAADTANAGTADTANAGTTTDSVGEVKDGNGSDKVAELLDEFRVANQTLAIRKSGTKRLQKIAADLKPFTERIDLSEPFERVHLAICQSHGIQSLGIQSHSVQSSGIQATGAAHVH